MRLIRLYVRVLGQLGSDLRVGAILALANVALAISAFAEPILFGRIIDVLTRGQIPGNAPVSFSTLMPLLVAWVAFGLFSIGAGALVALHADRLAHREVLTELVTAHTLQWQRDNLLAALEGVGVPAGPINTVADAFADPQVIARGMELTIPRVGGSPVPGVRTPIRFSRSRLAASSASPVLGKDEPGPSQSLHSP